MLYLIILASITVSPAFYLAARKLAVTQNVISHSSAKGSDHIPEQIEFASHLEKGVVLVTQSGEYNHFLHRQVIFLYEHGDSKESCGVLLERVTAFTMGEVSPGIGAFAPNPLFMGGEEGPDMAIMLHRCAFPQTKACKYVGSGIYLGGQQYAREYIEERKARPSDFKFFFNYVAWPVGVLEKECAEGKWDLMRVPPNLILEQKSVSPTLWQLCREKLKGSEER